MQLCIKVGIVLLDPVEKLALVGASEEVRERARLFGDEVEDDGEEH